MTVNLAPGTTPPAAVTGGRLPAGWRRFFLLVAIVALLFAATYALAWLDAGRLSAAYLQDAEASYTTGNYLEALAGYEEFDAARNEFVVHGGYLQVEQIWKHPNAWPVPDNVAHAKARIGEIINERFTVADAEQFVQENIGRTNPYLGDGYLRLGELYEEEGDSRSAEDIYREIEELFPNRPDLIARAQAHLARLEQ